MHTITGNSDYSDYSQNTVTEAKCNTPDVNTMLNHMCSSSGADRKWNGSYRSAFNVCILTRRISVSLNIRLSVFTSSITNLREKRTNWLTETTSIYISLKDERGEERERERIESETKTERHTKRDRQTDRDSHRQAERHTQREQGRASNSNHS